MSVASCAAMSTDSGYAPLRSVHPVNQLERLLLLKILSGEFPVGQLLPSIPQLALTYGVGRNTVIAALGALCARGLCRSTTGLGTRVTSSAYSAEFLREDLRRTLPALRSSVSVVEALLAILEGGSTDPSPS
jgi:DNA-binding GntR family transcriptional regulator